MEIKPTEEVSVYKSEESDEDPEEDPEEDAEEENEEYEEYIEEDSEEDAEEEYEEYIEEVSEEDLESDSKEELEKESNAKPNEETGFADKVLDHKITSSETPDESALKDGEEDEEEKDIKVRKTRWGSDVSQSKSKQNNVDVESDSRLRWLKQKLVVLNEEILRVEACKTNPEKEEARRTQIEFLVKKRQKLLAELISSEDSKLRVPKSCVQGKDKIFKKVYIPVKEYPSYNFVGLILDNKKKIEAESGASIKLQGKGSPCEDTKPEDDDEDLHVYIEANTEKSLEAAVAMVEKLLVPINDKDNKFQIPNIGTNLNACSFCNDPGHKSYACPNHRSNFEKVTSCTKCGSFSHLVSQCPVNTKPSPINKVINEANLYVAHLPHTADENWLKDRFCPFGKITSVRVINDHTTGLSKCYGFVNFESPIDAAMAVKHLNGHQVEGKALAVRVAGLPPQPNVPVLNPFPPGFMGPRIGPPGFFTGPWVGPPCFTGPGSIPRQQLPHQPGLSAFNPVLPYPRPAAAISPSISSQMGPWSGQPGSFQNQAMNIRSHFEPNYRSSFSGSFQFPGDPNYRSSSSLFPGDPDYRGSSTF